MGGTDEAPAGAPAQDTVRGGNDTSSPPEIEGDEPSVGSVFSFRMSSQPRSETDGGAQLRELRQHDHMEAARSADNNNLNAHQLQHPDEAGIELNSLDTLLAIDNLEEKFGVRGRESGEGDCPEAYSYQKPEDRSLHHVQGTGVEFVELSYTVVRKFRHKHGALITQKADLLHSITGAASKGEITAVMGPSGAGKSTLLDALAGRIDSRSLGGLIMVDGRPVSQTLMKRMSAYVMQDDQLYPLLTVWETLSFAANIRLPQHMSRAEKLDRIVTLIDQLGLTKVQNTFIGDEKTRGISGGEKRRVSIGVDIIHGPALLFMDEPTSGLDSTSAYNVIERIRDLAKTGSTVIITIHQPSSRILQQLNRLIVLARGQLVYQGSPDYLSTHLAGFDREVPRGENPAEYLLDVIQEYDKSPYGVEPLVAYNFDGSKFDTPSPEGAMFAEKQRSPGQRGTTGATTMNPDTQDGNHVYSDTQLQSEDLHNLSFKMADDETFDTMEIGDSKPTVQDNEDAFDHSISRSDGPKVLASLYHGGLIEALADNFLSPMASPLSTQSPGRTTLPSPRGRKSPMRMAATSPMKHKTSPFRRTLSRTPLLPPPTMSQQNENLTTFEIGPATPGATPPHPGDVPASNVRQAQENESNQASDNITVTEHAFDIPGSQESVSMQAQTKFANTWWREVLILIFRVLLNIKRSPELFLSRQMTLTLFALLASTLFLKMRHEKSSDQSNVTLTMAFFAMTLCLFYFTSTDAIPAFVMERFIYIRETSHNSYRASSYVMANLIVSFPLLAAQALTYALITWWALGFGDMGASDFGFFFLVLFASLLSTGSLVMFITAVVPNYILAYTFFLAILALYFIFSGYFVHRNDIPIYWIWLHYLSSMKYTYEALVLNEFGDKKHQSCYLVDSSDSTKCLLTGKELLNSLDVYQLTKWEALIVLCSMAAFYRFLFYCVLRFGSKNLRS